MKVSHMVIAALALAGTGLGFYELGYSRATRLQADAANVPSPSLASSTPSEIGTGQKPATTGSGKSLTTKAAPMPSEPRWKSSKETRLHWEERINAVRSLPDPITEATLNELLAFMHRPPDGRRGEWYVVCNEIMEVLRRRKILPEGYSKLMLGLSKDRTADPVIRDYAAQALGQWLTETATGQLPQPDSALAQQTFDALLDEARQPDNAHTTLAGTTLNMLAKVVTEGGPEVQAMRKNLAATALKFADGSVPASTINRACGIQVSARLGAPEVPGICRGLLGSESTAPDLRLSAIAGLGLTGSPRDVALLQNVSKTYQFKYAAEAAIARINTPAQP